jgi:putative hydrolase of the HAD superfamily
MIRTLIFDFGDVFINLDKEGAIKNALNLFKLSHLPKDLIATNEAYEVGSMNTQDFVDFYLKMFGFCSKEDIVKAWNYILKDFPEKRLEFLKSLRNKNQWQLILLSNTNAMHIDYVKTHVPFYEEFKACFDKFYLSHEIGMRKPNEDIFRFVLKENQLIPEECLFVDDTEENTLAANQLGIHTWNINEQHEDVTQLFDIKSDLF